VERADVCAVLPDVNSCDVAFGVLAVDTVLDAADDPISEVVQDVELGADDIACEDCVEASGDVADAERAGVEGAVEPEEVAGADDGGLEDGTGTGGFADALGVVEDQLALKILLGLMTPR